MLVGDFLPTSNPLYSVFDLYVQFHKSANALALIEATGARVEPLPAYSPNFNPKEECISKIKAELKRVKANTVHTLRNALRRAYAKVTLADVRRWFRHCGYSVT